MASKERDTRSRWGWRLLDLLYLARPVLVAVVWIFPLVGARGANQGLALLLGQVAALAGAAFIHNQLYDQAGDRLNGKCESLSRGLVGERTARLWMLALAVAGLACALALGARHLLASLGFLLLAAVGYNLPPIRAKDHPTRSLWLAAPAYALLTLQGAWLVPGLASRELAGRTLPVTLAGLALSVLATVPDQEGDRRTGKRTWTVAHGEASTWRMAMGGMLAATVAGALARDLQLGLAALAATAWIAWHSRPGGPRAATLALRGSVAMVALALLVSWPRISLAVLLFGALSRGYYRRRFALSYPGLGWERT